MSLFFFFSFLLFAAAVMIRTIEKEAPGTEVLSYADDTYLLAELEKTLQAAVNGTLEFCGLTGMKLNPEKTVAFGTKKGFRSKVLGDRTVTQKGREVAVPYRTVTSFKALGVMVFTNRTGTTWNEPATEAANKLDRLGGTSLSFETKGYLIGTSVLPSCLYSSPFSPPSDEALKKLTTRVTCNLWGPHFRGRSPAAVNTVLLKGHINDPLSYVICHSLKVISSALERTGLGQRVRQIVQRYGSQRTPLGPVGNLICRWMPRIGWDWEKMEIATELEWPKRGSAFRAAVRAARSATLATERKTVSGLGEGADPKTNDLWRTAKDRHLAFCIKRVIAGGIPYLSPYARAGPKCVPPTNEDDESEGRSEEEEDQDEPAAHEGQDESGFECDLCPTKHADTVTLLRHQLYECPPAREELIREEMEPLRDRTGWPLCLELHAILPRGNGFEHLEKLQRYLAMVVEKRDEG
eukprot:TRINITY_DN327_c2_g1_i2.p1 TRINITY_DN327_c2_g1~~TRINITY_DN327_c2_g1_i2.p1  ORF type:complete len:465 (+),score=59.60 TRINITY_DN327_c2_g1_i2:37-1431(+)